MKAYTGLLILNLISHSLLSQNLVNNPSFECGNTPCNPTQIHTDFLNQNYACGWSCPSGGTSDIYSTIFSDNECFTSMPYNGNIPYHWGTQAPRTGNRFAGIITHNPAAFFSSYREYLEVELKAALIPGEYYCAEMYVSAGDFVNRSANSLGMYFSDNLVEEHNNYATLPFSPQIEDRRMITDKINWIRISGTFKATSSAKFLVIGNFRTDGDIQTLYNPPVPDNDFQYTYYYIDDVSVEHIPSINFASPADASVCQGESVTLKANGNYENITWTTLTDTLTILGNKDSLKVIPVVTTKYRVQVRSCHMSVKDTVTITVNSFVKVNLGKDTTICEGSSIRLNAGSSLDSNFKWQDQSTNSYIDVTTPGKYSVDVTGINNCHGYDEVNISTTSVPRLDLGPDAVACKDFFPLHAGNGHNKYEWSDGSYDSIFTPSNPGFYWVKVDNQCGQSMDPVEYFEFYENEGVEVKEYKELISFINLLKNELEF
jgi:hypothetical protein